MGNPRRANGSARSRLLRWLRVQVAAHDLPCHICGMPIDLTLPAGHPMSLTADEVCPVSRWREGGYASAEECALDRSNVRPAHRICNIKRGNKPLSELGGTGPAAVANDLTLPLSRDW